MLKRRILSVLITLMVCVGMMPTSLITSFAAPTSSSFVSGTMDSEWTIVNPVTTGELAYELVKGSGLKLPTQASGMQQGTNADRDVSNPVNVFTRPADANSWEAVAKVYYPKAPVQNYQQIAFGVYQDANNYMKVDIEYNSGYGGRIAQFSINRNGTYTHTHRTAMSLNNTALTDNDANRLFNLVAYYKITKSGSIYTASVSFDGIEYITVGTGTGTGSTNTNGQYTAEYSAPKLFVAAVNDTTYSSSFDTYCEFVKVYGIDGGVSLNVLDSAMQDVVDYVNTETSGLNTVNGTMNLVAGNRYNDLLFSQFPSIPYGYNYKLVSGDTNLLEVNAETGVVSAQRAGSTTLALQIVNGSLSQTLKTINVTIGAGVEPVTVTFNYNYTGAPAAPASFTKQTVGGKLESFPVEQTLPQYGSRADYGFIGWYTTASGAGEKVTIDRVFTQNTTLYARWEQTPALWREFEGYFLMGAFQDFSSTNSQMTKHYNINCPSNSFKLDSQIGNSNTASNSRSAYNTEISRINALSISDEEKAILKQKANEDVRLATTRSVVTTLNNIVTWNNNNPTNKKYTRFHTVMWHGGQQPKYFFTNGFTYSSDAASNAAAPGADGSWASRETMKARVDNYIKALVEAYLPYKDIIVSWDIINEPIDDFSGQVRNMTESSSQRGDWGKIWHDQDPARNADGSIKFTTAKDRMNIVWDQNRLYDESEFIRWGFESAAKWFDYYGCDWGMYVNDYMDSNKPYTKLQPTLDVIKWISDDVDTKGHDVIYGMQGRLAWAYPTVDMLRKQVEDALEICDGIGVTENDVRTDFEPNPYYNPFYPTVPVTSTSAPQWNYNDLNSGSGSSSNPSSSTLTNTFDAHNGPSRRMPEWNTGAGTILVTANRVNNSATDGRSYNIISNNEYFSISESNMKKQADFAADWVDILVSHADKVELFQWDGTTDSSTFNSSKGAHMWVNSGIGRTGAFEKYSFYAVIGSPARDKLKTAINAFPPSYWADNQAAYDEAEALLAKRIYTLEGVNDVKELTASLITALAALNSAYITYDANGGSGTISTETYAKNAEAVAKTAAAVGFSKTDYVLEGWNTSANGVGTAYAPGDTVAMSTSVRLYAQWKKAPSMVTVAFDSHSNGTGAALVDSAYPPVQIAAGSTITKPTVNPYKEGYKFEGWYRDMAMTKLWDFSTPVTQNMRLYALFAEVPPPQAASISVDGVLIPEFQPDVYNYTLTYDVIRSASPVVTAAAADEAFDVEISYPVVGVPGQATVKISGEGGSNTVYTINFEVLPPKIVSFTFNGDVFNAVDKAEFDVNVPKAVTNISFSAADVTSAYPGDVDISVTLSPATGAVNVGAPCVATITAAWKGHPSISTVYTVNFGYLTVGDLNVKPGSGGYAASADIRFGDGVTGYYLIHAVYKDNRLIAISEKWTDAVDKHQTGTVSSTPSGALTASIDSETTVKVFLWDQNFVPLASAYDNSALVETEIWKVAKTIEAGKSYVIVAVNPSRALTTTSASVPVGNGVSVARTGRAGAAVTVDGDYIISPLPAETPANMIWDISTSGAHPNPGPFAGQTGFFIRNGTGTSNYLLRESSSSTATAPLSMGTSTTTNNMAIWFFQTPNATTGQTSACLYSYNDASNAWVFALFGNISGFVAEGGNIISGSDPAPYQNAAPIKLYEKVIEMRPAL